MAITIASESSLLLGSHKWTVFNDSEKCSRANAPYTKILTLHTCKPELEFACDNAICVMTQKRCDGKEDCDDGSDEQDCGKLIIKPGYKKSLTPVGKFDNNVLVKFFLYISSILETDELTESFTVKILI